MILDLPERLLVPLLWWQPDLGARTATLQRGHDPAHRDLALVADIQEVEDFADDDVAAEEQGDAVLGATPAGGLAAHAPGGVRLGCVYEVQAIELLGEVLQVPQLRPLGRPELHEGVRDVRRALDAARPQVLQRAGRGEVVDAFDDVEHRLLSFLMNVDQLEQRPRLGFFEVQRQENGHEARQLNLYLILNLLGQRVGKLLPKGLQDAPEAPTDLQPEVLEGERRLSNPQRRDKLLPGNLAIAVQIDLPKCLLGLLLNQPEPVSGLLGKFARRDRAALVLVDLPVSLVDTFVSLHDACATIFQQQVRRHCCECRQQLLQRSLRVVASVAADGREQGLVLVRLEHVDALQGPAEVLVGHAFIHVNVDDLLGLPHGAGHRVVS
mmetsp:Transcript_76864/g.248978  ORF Transcript_76864/g.248978 Transcript_76864/m.248978 type:complete len:381 (-) Transcript_76864:1363-2505(-)